MGTRLLLQSCLLLLSITWIGCVPVKENVVGHSKREDCGNFETCSSHSDCSPGCDLSCNEYFGICEPRRTNQNPQLLMKRSPFSSKFKRGKKPRLHKSNQKGRSSF